MFLSTKMTKSILDPIHGLIRMTDEEMNIISQPLFNRLRGIKQNSFLYYIFPSANHTRFEHSIGVMHLASEMFLNAFYNSNTHGEKQGKYDIEGNKNTLSIKDIPHLEALFLDLRIAALLHDIGHGPMSHLFNKFAPSKDEFLNLIGKDKNVKDDLYQAIENSFRNNESDKVDHETISSYFTLLILKDVGFSEKRINRISSIMNADINLIKENVIVDGENYNIIPFLSHIVAGAPLDCDRMDYLLRDSYFSGVKYGMYDLNRVLKSLVPFIDIKNKVIQLGIKKSGLPAIENFLNARYEMYVQVYFHKTNRASSSMLEVATKQLVDRKYKFVNSSAPSEFINSYMILSDEQFLKDLREAIHVTNDKKTIDELMKRKLWKRVIELYPQVGEANFNMKEKLKQHYDYIIKNYPELKSFIKVDLIDYDPLKDVNTDKSILLEKDIDENYNPTEKMDWVNNSHRIATLKEHYLVGRIFMRVGENEKAKFREIKAKVNKLYNVNK